MSIQGTENLQQINHKIQHYAEHAGRDLAQIQLIVVSKTRALVEVENLQQVGQHHFAENTIQDALTKIPQLQQKQLSWHFIGHLQSNKSKQLVANFDWLHTLDTLKLAKKLSQALEALTFDKNKKPLNCLIQVNLSGEGSKSGISKKQLMPLIQNLLDLQLPHIKLRGLMTMGVKNDATQTRAIFAQLKTLQLQIKQQFSLETFDQLSMGMSGDYKIAIEEGATLLRIGSAVFGERAKISND